MIMKREIKFRAWDKNNQKMIYHPTFLHPAQDGHLVVQTLDCCILPECKEKEGCEHLQYDTNDYLDGGLYDYPAVLMQYTGLKDGNQARWKKEIYEGDIVEDKKGQRWIIQYQEEWGAFIAEVPGADILFLAKDKRWGDNKLLVSEVKVIGNIYENPELLETK